MCVLDPLLVPRCPRVVPGDVRRGFAHDLVHSARELRSVGPRDDRDTAWRGDVRRLEPGEVERDERVAEDLLEAASRREGDAVGVGVEHPGLELRSAVPARPGGHGLVERRAGAAPARRRQDRHGTIASSGVAASGWSRRPPCRPARRRARRGTRRGRDTRRGSSRGRPRSPPSSGRRRSRCRASARRLSRPRQGGAPRRPRAASVFLEGVLLADWRNRRRRDVGLELQLYDIRGRSGFDVVGSPVELQAEVPGWPRKSTGNTYMRITNSHTPPK